MIIGHQNIWIGREVMTQTAVVGLNEKNSQKFLLDSVNLIKILKSRMAQGFIDLIRFAKLQRADLVQREKFSILD
jgi:hypothetical protein